MVGSDIGSVEILCVFPGIIYVLDVDCRIRISVTFQVLYVIMNVIMKNPAYSELVFQLTVTGVNSNCHCGFGIVKLLVHNLIHCDFYWDRLLLAPLLKSFPD